jgi:hypothetical protein
MHLPPEMLSRRSPPYSIQHCDHVRGFGTGKRAKKALDYVAEELGNDLEFRHSMWRLQSCRSRNSKQWWGEMTETPSDISNDANRLLFTHCCKLILAFSRKAKSRHG